MVLCWSKTSVWRKVSDYCFTPSEECFRYIMAGTSCITWCCLMCTRSSYIAGCLLRLFTEKTIREYTCHSTRAHYPDSEPIQLRSCSLILRAWRKSNKYQFVSSLVWDRTRDLPYSKQTSLPLQYRRSSYIKLYVMWKLNTCIWSE
jgi:hypothetical protein